MAPKTKKRKKITHPDRRKSKKAKLEVKEQSSEEEEEEEKEEEEEEFEEFEEFDKSNYQLSELELLRQENMKKNLELFDEFKINKAKHEVLEISKPKLAVVGLKTRKRLKKPQELLPRRVSMRLRSKEGDTSVNYKEPTLNDLYSQVKTSYYSHHDYHTRKAETIAMGGDEEEECNFSEIIKTWKNEKQTIDTDVKPCVEFSKYSKSINKFSVTHCGKVGQSRICSAAVHPATNKTIAAFGDKEGHIGIWDVGSNIKCEGYPASEEVLLFEPHCSPIQCLKFQENDCNKLVSCSYDGTIRQADFVAEKFSQIFAFEDEDVRIYFFSCPRNKPTTFLASTSDGTIAVIDANSGKLEQSIPLFKKNVKCVDCHPMDENIFAAVSSDGTCGTWDLRKLKTNGTNQPLSYCKATKTGNTAFFLPNSGNKLLYTAYDNYVRIFDVQSGGTFSSKPSWRISHNNHTGRWLTPFRATWDPKTEDSFVIGSMGHPRKLDVYACLPSNQVEWIRLFDENFTTVGSVNAFHPTKNILVSGNASGKAYVWT